MASVAIIGAVGWALYNSFRPANAQEAGFTRDDARRIVSGLNDAEFGGWFTSGNRKIDDVLGVFEVESNFDPSAIGDLHLPDKSWGIGQVRGSTAGDYGITNPRDLLVPVTGIFVAMKHLKWSHDYLMRSLGRAPSFDEWIGSYNAGVGAVSRGAMPTAYVWKWRKAAGR